MKFASIAVALTLAATANAFAPNAPVNRVANTGVNNIVAGPVSTSARNTELNLFGFGKKTSEVKSDITEKEVRALFELWNAALATGDSRIVASRYTKVSYDCVIYDTSSDKYCCSGRP